MHSGVFTAIAISWRSCNQGRAWTILCAAPAPRCTRTEFEMPIRD